MKRQLRLLPPRLLLLLVCCGCRLGGSIEDLYSLPQTAEAQKASALGSPRMSKAPVSANSQGYGLLNPLPSGV